MIRAMTVCLSAFAGFVDALGYLSLGGFYVAFMSGNSTLLGVGAAEHAGGRAGLAAGLVLAFVLGVMTGTLVGRRFGGDRPVAVLLLVGGVLAAAGIVHLAGAAVPGAFLIAVAMGAENTVFAKEGQPAIGLTYMTGTLVRLGQRLADAMVGGAWAALVPDTLLWAGMVVGAFAGALLFGVLGLGGLWVAVGATLVMAGAVWMQTRSA